MRLLSKLASSGDDVKGLSLDLLPHDGWVNDDGLLIPPWSTSMAADREAVDHTFAGFVNSAYKRNGVVFACVMARALPFSEARFQFQRLTGGRPGDLFGTPDLGLLERPWLNGTTGELLIRMEQDASLAGNSYWTPFGSGASRRLRRLRPDWVTVLSGVRGDGDGSPLALEAEVLGYIYAPPVSAGRTTNPVFLTPDRVVHYSPIPDPDAQWRGMSWLSPIMREIEADTATTTHKLKFFEHGATPPFAIKYDPSISPEAFQRFVEHFKREHSGTANAYKVLHLGGGADPTTVGTDLRQLDFKATQGAGETRIAAAAGVGAIIARLSEGMQGSSLNSGNYNAAKRQFADMTIRPLWRTVAASLDKPSVCGTQAGARLWYDARDVAFLAEDERDAAEIQGRQAETIARLTDAGYDPGSVVAAVRAGDFSLLQHSGLYSVQLQPASAGIAQGGAT